MNMKKVLLTCGVFGTWMALCNWVVDIAYESGKFYGIGRSEGLVEVLLIEFGSNQEELFKNFEDSLLDKLPNTFKGKVLKYEAQKGFHDGKQQAVTIEMEDLFKGGSH